MSPRLQVLDGVLLVGLHADGGGLEAKGLHEDAHAAQDSLSLLQHEPVVGGDVGLTLRAVEDECVHLADARADLHMGGEARAAHTGNAGLLDDFHNLVRGEAGVIGMGGELGAEGILEIVVDDHGHDLRAARVGAGLHRRDRTGHGRVDGCAKTGDLTDLLSHRHLVALGNDGLAGGADVHRHGDDHLLGRCAQGLYRLFAGCTLPVIGVHAAVKGLLHRSTSQIRPTHGPFL